jgi:hypothetical protein
MTIALKLCVLESSPRNNPGVVVDFMGGRLATVRAVGKKYFPNAKLLIENGRKSMSNVTCCGKTFALFLRVSG